MKLETLPATSRRWNVRAAAADADVVALARALDLPEPLCRLLVQRGHRTEESVRAFLRPKLSTLLDPHGLAGIGDAVDRLARAIRGGETVLVHGDYDVDGVASTALYTRVIRALGGKAEPFVPQRLRDGYDLSEAGVRAALTAEATVILSADCGTVAHEAVLAARAANIDVIVTDHHTPGESLPAALAVVNPNRADCGYAEKTLVGCGVAFKLAQALWRAFGRDGEELLWHLDLVALATVADLAPLTGENRVMVRFGLRVIRDSRKVGIRALVKSAGLAGQAVSAGQVGHVLAPRINAVGRLGDAMWGVRLLLTEEEGEAEAIAARLERENRERQDTDRRMVDEALELLGVDYDPERDRGIVLARAGWHPGVIGIVASRVVERIHRPVVLIALDETGTRARGSARSIPGFHLYRAIAACSHLLERFGGHRQAAGLDIHPDNIDAFRAAFDAEARAALRPEQLVPDIHIDLEVELREANADLHRLMRHCAPFGMGNPTPMLLARNVEVARWKIVGESHLRVDLRQGDARLQAIGFRMAERAPELAGGRLDVAFQLHEDSWNGHTRLQAKIADFRPAG